MKKTITSIFTFLSVLAFSQVGIKTQTPRGALDVNGSLLIDSYLILEETKDATGDFHLLVRSEDTTPVGEVKKLDVDKRAVAPVNKYNVVINNVDRATVLNLNTNLDASKYYLGLAEAYFDAPVRRFSLQSTGSGSPSVPVHGTYKTAVGVNADGKYTVSLNFNGAQSSANGTWHVSFIVFEKILVKDWGVVNGSVIPNANPVYTGASTNTPAGLL